MSLRYPSVAIHREVTNVSARRKRLACVVLFRRTVWPSYNYLGKRFAASKTVVDLFYMSPAKACLQRKHRCRFSIVKITHPSH